MTKLHPRIRQIAWNVRRWAERQQKKNPDEYQGDLCGLCAVASGRLHIQLAQEGFDSLLVQGFGHFFVVINENTVVDVTATQFRLNWFRVKGRISVVPKVLVRPWKELDKSLYCPWTEYRVYDSVDDMIQDQIESDWPESQIPQNWQLP